MNVVINFIDPKVPDVEATEDRVFLGFSGPFVRVDHLDGKGHTLFPVRTIWRIEYREDEA